MQDKQIKREIGRPQRGERRMRTNFSLSLSTIEELEARIPQGERSAFIEKLLIEAFRKDDEQLPKAS